MTIQLTQICNNNVYKDDVYATINEDIEIEGLLFLKFYKNVNSITVELLQTARKDAIRKILLMKFINKVVYRNEAGEKEEISSNGKVIIKMNEAEDSDLVLDDTIIKFQEILDIQDDVVVVKSPRMLNEELLEILEANDIKFIRITEYGKQQYTLLEVRSMLTKVKNYINVAKTKSANTEKFIELYTTLAKEITVDYLGNSYGNICDIVYNKTSMSGFANILKYILDTMKIENKVIKGNITEGKAHVWNQVYIDYIWYNVDLALDAKGYAEKGEIKYCLKSDEIFYKNHVALSENIEVCSCDSNYVVVKEIKKPEGFIKKFFKKIKLLIRGNEVKRLSAGLNKE